MVKWSLCDSWLKCITCAMWGSTCGVAEPLLQAELLLDTVVYCEVDCRWQWIGCSSCTGYAVTDVTAGNTSTICKVDIPML